MLCLQAIAAATLELTGTCTWKNLNGFWYAAGQTASGHVYFQKEGVERSWWSTWSSRYVNSVTHLVLYYDPECSSLRPSRWIIAEMSDFDYSATSNLGGSCHSYSPEISSSVSSEFPTSGEWNMVFGYCSSSSVDRILNFKLQKPRLVEGSDLAGHLEIYFEGSWAAVCANGWDDVDAQVVCDELGLQGGSASRISNARNATSVLDEVTCNGDEVGLGLCAGRVGLQSCTELAAVECEARFEELSECAYWLL